MVTTRQKTATFRFDPETHSLLDELAREYGQNKTQVLKRMIREETARIRRPLLTQAEYYNACKTYPCPGCEECCP